MYGLSVDMLRSKKIVPVGSVSKMPSCLTFEEASALPVAYLTVLYAMKDQAKLADGERILIHSAAGGVGLAAVQYAQSVGAKVYATASPSKHDYLQGVGVCDVTTSRDGTVFAKAMSRLLGDELFDVVLSAGNLVDESLGLLRPGGRFVELGKRNILSQKEMRERRPDVEYFTYTLNELLHDQPEATSTRLSELSTYIESGVLHPLKCEVFEFQTGLINAFK